MKKVIFKIGGTFSEDLKKIAKNPRRLVRGTTTVYFKTLEQFREMLTKKRLELLDELVRFEEPLNISEISTRLKRKQAAVSRDLSVLEKNGLITKTKQKQAVHPKLAFSKIEIELAKATA